MSVERKAEVKNKPLERETPAAENASAEPVGSGGLGQSKELHAPPPNSTARALRQANLRQMQRQIGNASVQRLLAPASTQPAEVPLSDRAEAGGLIVDDEFEAAGPHQMRKSAFLAELRASVETMVQAELAGFSLIDQADQEIERQFLTYAQLDAAALEQTIRREVADTRQAAGAQEYIPRVCERVRAAIAAQRAGMPLGADALVGAASSLASAIGGIFLKPEAGAAPATADPHAVRAQLGAGQELAGAVRADMESSFGESFGDVRLHTDPGAAAMASNLGARAFAVGDHIAFGGGQYRPGTPIGDALLAHELAHVVQQRGAQDAAPMQKGGGEYGALEANADTAAVGAVVSLWGGATGALGKFARQALPQLKSALRLQLNSCPGGTAEPVVEEAAEVDPNLQITSNIQGERAGQGAKATYRVTGFAPTMPPSEPLPYWRVTQPDGSELRTSIYSSYTQDATLEQIGTYRILAVAPRGANRYVAVRYEQVVVSVSDLASQEIGQMRQDDERTRGQLRPGQQLPSDYERFRLSMAFTQTNLERGATHTESGMRAGDTYISSDAANPIQAPAGFPSSQEGRYTIHPSPGARQFHWYAIPSRNENLFPDYHGFHLITFQDQQAYDLGTGTSARWVLFERNTYMIVCEQRDERGQLVQAMPYVRYRQVVLGEADMRKLQNFRQYMGRADHQIQSIQAGHEIGLRAVHVHRDNSAVTRLNMFAGPARDGNSVVLVDLTAGLGDRHVEHPGATADAVFAHLRDNNDYPPGQIRIEVPPSQDQRLFAAGRVETVRTTGETFIGSIASGTGIASMGLAALGVLAVATGVGAVAAPYLFVAAAASGGVSAGLSLADHLRQTEVSGTMVALDVLGIASSFLGGATAFRALGGPLALAARSTQFLIWSQFTTDVVSGVLLSVDGWQQIVGVMDNPQMSPQQRMDAIMRILGHLALNGGLMVYGARDLGQAARRFEQAGVRAIGNLSSEQRYALSILIRDEALPSLARASADDLARLVPLARENHELVNRLLVTRGEDFLTELRQGRHTTIEEVAHALGEPIPPRAPVNIGAAGTTPSEAEQATGGVRGRVYEGSGNPRRFSPERLDRALGPIAQRPRIHGATLRRQGDNHFIMSVPQPDGTLSQVNVRFNVHEDVGTLPNRPHQVPGGNEAGPAQLNLNPPAGGGQPWEATVVVQRNLHQQDELAYVVGHELDEIANTVRSHPNARTRAEIAGEHEAGLLRDGSTSTRITAHDRAAARELGDTFADLRDMRTRRGALEGQRAAANQQGQPQVAARLDQQIAELDQRIRSFETRINRMRVWMGLDELTHMPEKLAVLRSSGAPEEMVQLVEARAELRTYLESSRFRSLAESSSLIRSSGTTMHDELVQHLLNVDHPNGSFLRNGLYGGHQTQRLVAWVEQHLEYELVETASRTAGGTRFRRFTQYRWVGGGPPPPRGDVRRQPASLANERMWQLSTQPKTTADDLGALMREADDAFTQWRSAYPSLARTGESFGRGMRGGPPALSNNGVEFTGFYNYTPAQLVADPSAGGERWSLRSIFVENQWF